MRAGLNERLPTGHASAKEGAFCGGQGSSGEEGEMVQVEQRLIWKGRITLSAYQGKPCGDDVWSYEPKHWARNEFDVRVILDPEGSLRSEYLADTVQPDALKPAIEKWVTLYKDNHADALEACLLGLINTQPIGARNGEPS